MLMVAGLFVALVVAGLVLGELDWRSAGGFVLAAVGLFAGFAAFRWPLMWYTAALAGVDIVLVLWVFKGNLPPVRTLPARSCGPFGGSERPGYARVAGFDSHTFSSWSAAGSSPAAAVRRVCRRTVSGATRIV